ncbi:MAG: YfhO family protein [bacterium]|nr:YfhO family protein [bacterium]
MTKKENSSKSVGSNFSIACIYFILLLFFFHKVLIHPDWIVFGTDAMDRVSITAYIRDMVLNNGQFPLWIPAHFSGLPHIDATHSIQFNIYCLMYYIMPLPLAFNLFMIAHFFFAGFFTYIFAKEVGLKKSGAFMAGLVFMFSGVLVSHMYVGHMAKIVTWAYIPLLLFLVSQGIEKRRITYFLIAGIVMGHQFLGGHMQMAYYSTLFVGVFVLFKIYVCRRKGEKLHIWLLKPGAYFVLATTIAVLLYSIQLIPSYLYTQKYSERSGGTSYEFSTSWSFSPKELPGIFVRDPFGWERPKKDEYFQHVNMEGSFPDNFVDYWGPMPQRLAGEYFGVLPLILALIGIVFRRDRFSWFFTGAAVLTLLLSMGKYTPLYWLAYKLVFGFSYFRVPLSIFALTVFALSILAGRGLDFILSEKSDKEKKDSKKLVMVMFVFGVLSLVATALIGLFGESYLTALQSPFDKFRLAGQSFTYSEILMDRLVKIRQGMVVLTIFTALSTAALYLYFIGKLKKNHLTVVLLLIVIIDLWAYGYDFIKYAKIDDNSFYGKYDSVKLLNKEKETEKFRALAIDDRSIPNGYINMRSFSYHGIELINGRHDLAPIYYQQLQKIAITNPKLLSLLNTKYILVSENNDLRRVFRGMPDMEKKIPLIMKDEKFKMYKNKAYLDRAFIVNQVRIVSDEKYVLGYMTKTAFDPVAEVVLEEKPVRPDGKVNAPADANRATIESYTPNHVTINAELKQEGVLVLADTYYPDWKVYVDGVEGKIYKADYALRGVYLTAGTHKVEFVYDSKILKITGAVSLVTLILTLGGIIFIYRRERRGAPLAI